MIKDRIILIYFEGGIRYQIRYILISSKYISRAIQINVGIIAHKINWNIWFMLISLKLKENSVYGQKVT